MRSKGRGVEPARFEAVRRRFELWRSKRHGRARIRGLIAPHPRATRRGAVSPTLRGLQLGPAQRRPARHGLSRIAAGFASRGPHRAAAGAEVQSPGAAASDTLPHHAPLEPTRGAAARYVEMNPVKAGLVRRPWRYRWSSAAAHLNGREDGLVYAEPLLELVGDWGKFLSQPVEPQGVEKLQAHERTGRPLGNDAFVAKLERRLHRPLRPRKPGRKPKETNKRPKKYVWCPPIEAWAGPAIIEMLPFPANMPT